MNEYHRKSAVKRFFVFVFLLLFFYIYIYCGIPLYIIVFKIYLMDPISDKTVCRTLVNMDDKLRNIIEIFRCIIFVHDVSCINHQPIC